MGKRNFNVQKHLKEFRERLYKERLSSKKDVSTEVERGSLNILEQNIISHEYANIDEDIIVSVINDDLLPLKEAIESLIKKY